MLDLQHIAVRYRLGLVDTDSLVAVADTLLVEGRDTPSVIQLSILESPVMEEAAPLFERICADYGVRLPTKAEAIHDLLRARVEAISTGECPPIKGLKAIMQEIYYPFISGEPCKKYVGDSRGLEHLIGAYWNYDDLMDQSRVVWWDKERGAKEIAQLEEYIQEQARAWLEKYDHRA